MIRVICKLLACLSVLLPAAAFGKVDLRVDIGWNGAFRAGRWAPVYITAADDTALPARNVIIEIIAPHDKTFSLRILNPATIRPDPTTILVYVPLTFQLDETVAIIRDPNGFKKLAEMPFDTSQNSNGQYGRVYQNYGSGGGEILLGVSGAAQHGLNLGFEDRQLEGLGQVIVGARRVTDESIGRFAHLGEHEDRYAGCAVVATKAVGQLEAVQLRHSNVGDDQVWDALVDQLERLDSVARLAHVVALSLEEAADHLLDHAVVVDEDDVFHAHQATSAVSLEAIARARSRRV